MSSESQSGVGELKQEVFYRFVDNLCVFFECVLKRFFVFDLCLHLIVFNLFPKSNEISEA